MLRKVLSRGLNQDTLGKMLRSPKNICPAIWILHNRMENLLGGEQHLSHLKCESQPHGHRFSLLVLCCMTDTPGRRVQENNKHVGANSLPCWFKTKIAWQYLLIFVYEAVGGRENPPLTENRSSAEMLPFVKNAHLPRELCNVCRFPAYDFYHF